MDKGTKVAVVTGGSRGIGQKVAQGLAEEGHVLALVARNRTDLSDLVAEMEQPALHSTHVADLGDPQAITFMLRLSPSMRIKEILLECRRSLA